MTPTNDAPVTVEPSKPGFYWCKSKYPSDSEWEVCRVWNEFGRLRVAEARVGVGWGDLHEYEWGAEVPDRLAALASSPAAFTAFEPTEAMWQAAWDASEEYFISDKATVEGFRIAIRAMLTAASASAPAWDGAELNAHVRRMQQACANYLEPTTYIARYPDLERIGDCAWVREFPLPDPNASVQGAAECRERRDAAFIRDMIYMLDGPEQRAAQAALARPRAAVGEQSRDEIARIIAPYDWQRHDEILANLQYENAAGQSLQRAAAARLVESSLIKADAILALQSPPAKE